VPISNPDRKSGKSNYGIGRTIRVFFDLIMVKFLLDYSTRPLQFFGMLGLRGREADLCWACCWWGARFLPPEHHDGTRAVTVALHCAVCQRNSVHLHGNCWRDQFAHILRIAEQGIYALREVRATARNWAIPQSLRAKRSSER